MCTMGISTLALFGNLSAVIGSQMPPLGISWRQVKCLTTRILVMLMSQILALGVPSSNWQNEPKGGPPDFADRGFARVALVVEGEAPREQLVSHDAC